MGPHLDRYSATWQATKLLLQGCFCRCHTPYSLYLSLFVQHAIPAVLVSQVHPDRNPVLGADLPLRTLSNSAVILLHSRSPFALRVRIHWKLTASRWGRPSHAISATDSKTRSTFRARKRAGADPFFTDP